MDDIVIALGSNLGEKSLNIEQALYSISSFIEITAISSFFYSDPQLKDESPPEWNKHFLNLAFKCSTSYSPNQILHKLKEIELSINFIRNRNIWAARKIDLDIILYNNTLITSKTLTVPHKEMLSRDFVLLPLQQLLPRYRFHDNNNVKKYGKSINQLYKEITKYYIFQTQ